MTDALTQNHPADDGVLQADPIEGAHDLRTPAEEVQSTDTSADEPDTFPREYVEKLRKEAADHRAKAKDRDALAKELFTAKVSSLGLLADPTDLAFDEALLADPDALKAAVEDLVGRKPHLASRQPRGAVGQGASAAGDAVSLADLLKAGAA